MTPHKHEVAEVRQGFHVYNSPVDDLQAIKLWLQVSGFSLLMQLGYSLLVFVSCQSNEAVASSYC